MSNARFSVLQATAVKDIRISDSQFRTLAALGMYADENGWCFPSLTTLGEDLGKSKQAVGRDTIALRKLGYLEVRHRYDKKTKGRHSNLYRLRFDLPFSQPVVDGVSTSEVDGVSTSEVDVNVPLNVPINRNSKTSSVSDETRKSLAMSLFGALAGDTAYQADPEQVALQNIRQTWDKIMRTNSPWERWSTFDKWLLSEERKGRTVETFCRWFVSDKFRAGMVGTWTPKGNKQGQWSFMAIYPQAFPAEDNTAAAQKFETDEVQRTLPPAALRDQAHARLAAIRGVTAQ